VTSTGEEADADKAIFRVRQGSLRHGLSNCQHLDNLATDSVWIETDSGKPATIGAADTPMLSLRAPWKIEYRSGETLAGKAGA